MNNEFFSSNSDNNFNPNPLADQWSDLVSNSSDNPKSNSSPTENFDHLQDLHRQLAEEQLELKNLEGELAITEAMSRIIDRQSEAEIAEQKRQDEAYEAELAEQQRQAAEDDAAYESMLAEIRQQDAEHAKLMAELERQEAEDERSNAEYIFSNVDLDFYNIQPDPDVALNNLLGLIGIYANIKPFALDHLNLIPEDPDYPEDSERSIQNAESTLQDIQKYLSDLGITLVYNIDTSEDKYPPFVSWYASKDPSLIKEFQDLQVQYYNATSDEKRDNITRREGQLFGYPATATEYFIRQAHEHGDNPTEPPVDGGIGPKFSRCEYVHSPEHAEEEYASYEAPLYAALHKYYPAYASRLDAQLSDPENPTK